MFTSIIVLAAAALFASVALAFGIGAADAVRNVGLHYVRRTTAGSEDQAGELQGRSSSLQVAVVVENLSRRGLGAGASLERSR